MKVEIIRFGEGKETIIDIDKCSVMIRQGDEPHLGIYHGTFADASLLFDEFDRIIGEEGYPELKVPRLPRKGLRSGWTNEPGDTGWPTPHKR